MNTDLPQLEQTIIDIARQELAAVAAFYRKKEKGPVNGNFDEAWSEYLGRYHALSTLLVLGQLPNSGMSEEAPGYCGISKLSTLLSGFRPIELMRL